MSTNDSVVIITKGPPVPKFAMAAMLILVASVAVMVIFMRSKPASAQEAVPGQDLVVGVEDATLYVPKDAATMAGVISITALDSNLYPVAGEEWIRPQVVDIQYLNRDGVPYLHVVFPKPVLICFGIKERWQDYTEHPDEYLVQYYAEEQDAPGWVTLPMSTNPDRYQLCGQTDHLSIFALAVKPQKEIPITGGGGSSTSSSNTLTPTSMGSISPLLPTQTPSKVSSSGDVVATPVSTQAALTATSVALTATDVPTAVPPTEIPPTATDAPPPPTATDVPPTVEPPTAEPPTAEPPTAEPPTAEPPTAEPPTAEPPPTPEPPPIDPPTPEPPAVILPTGFQLIYQLGLQLILL